MNSLRRLALALLAVAASTLVAVGVASPARAATTPITTRVAYLAVPAAEVQYEAKVTIRVQIQAWSATDKTWDYLPSGCGTVVLQSRAAGASAWTTVATSTQDSGATWTVAPGTNTTYRVVYLGYDDTSRGVTFKASTGANRGVKVARDLGDSFHSKTHTVTGHVSPAYRNSKITLQKSSCIKGCAWHKVKTFKTNASSHYTYQLPIYKKATYFRLVIPGNKFYAVSYSHHWFETWRF